MDTKADTVPYMFESHNSYITISSTLASPLSIMFNDVLLEFVLSYVVLLGRRLVCVKVMQMLLIEI
jgi:hypothetical protein